MNLFLAKPSVYTLPGTWEKQPMIHHLNLSPGQGFAVFMGLLVVSLMVYGLYMTFGAGKEGLRDEIDEHAKMHELGIAHGHNERKR